MNKKKGKSTVRPEWYGLEWEENKYRAWLEVEILADEAWRKLGNPKEDVAFVREAGLFDISILEWAGRRATMWWHSRAVSGAAAAQGHYGYRRGGYACSYYKQASLTSSVVTKTSASIIADKAKSSFTIMMGRTGIACGTYGFGLKLATWYSEMKRNIGRFEHAAAASGW